MLLQEDHFVAPVPESSPTRERRLRPLLLGALATLTLVAAAGTGGYFVGKDTRMSAAEVAQVTDRAVQVETQRQEGLRRKALDERKARDAAVLRRVVTKMKRSAARRAQQAYASGQSAGYSSGQSAGYSSGKEQGETEGYVAGSADGFEDGLTEGSDDLSCSDDMDVYWLPTC